MLCAGAGIPSKTAFKFSTGTRRCACRPIAWISRIGVLCGACDVAQNEFMRCLRVGVVHRSETRDLRRFSKLEFRHRAERYNPEHCGAFASLFALVDLCVHAQSFVYDPSRKSQMLVQYPMQFSLGDPNVYGQQGVC